MQIIFDVTDGDDIVKSTQLKQSAHSLNPSNLSFYATAQQTKTLHRHEHNSEIVDPLDSLVSDSSNAHKVDAEPAPNNFSHGQPPAVCLEHCDHLSQPEHQLQVRMRWNVEDSY